MSQSQTHVPIWRGNCSSEDPSPRGVHHTCGSVCRLGTADGKMASITHLLQPHFENGKLEGDQWNLTGKRLCWKDQVTNPRCPAHADLMVSRRVWPVIGSLKSMPPLCADHNFTIGTCFGLLVFEMQGKIQLRHKWGRRERSGKEALPVGKEVTAAVSECLRRLCKALTSSFDEVCMG